MLARLGEPGVTVKGVAREFGISANSVRSWRQQDLGDALPTAVVDAERQELQRLRRENAQLREECEVLRRTAAGSSGSSQHYRLLLKRRRSSSAAAGAFPVEVRAGRDVEREGDGVEIVAW